MVIQCVSHKVPFPFHKHVLISQWLIKTKVCPLLHSGTMMWTFNTYMYCNLLVNYITVSVKYIIIATAYNIVIKYTYIHTYRGMS